MLVLDNYMHNEASRAGEPDDLTYQREIIGALILLSNFTVMAWPALQLVLLGGTSIFKMQPPVIAKLQCCWPSTNNNIITNSKITTNNCIITNSQIRANRCIASKTDIPRLCIQPKSSTTIITKCSICALNALIYKYDISRK